DQHCCAHIRLIYRQYPRVLCVSSLASCSQRTIVYWSIDHCRCPYASGMGTVPRLLRRVHGRDQPPLSVQLRRCGSAALLAQVRHPHSTLHLICLDDAPIRVCQPHLASTSSSLVVAHFSFKRSWRRQPFALRLCLSRWTVCTTLDALACPAHARLLGRCRQFPLLGT